MAESTPKQRCNARTGRPQRRAVGLLLLLLPVLASAALPPMFTRQIDVGTGLSQNTVFATLQDRRGAIWIATEQGLNRYDGYEIEQFHRSSDDSTGLPDSFVYDLAEDALGNVWIATARGGLAVWDPQSGLIKRQPLNNGAGVPVRNLRALYLDADDTLWIGTLGQGLLRLDAQRRPQPPPVHTGDKPTHVYDIAAGRDGDLWLGSDTGVYRWRQASDAVSNAAQAPGADSGLRSSRVRSLLVDDRGTLWAGTLDGGLHSYDPLAARFQPSAARIGASKASIDTRIYSLHQGLDGRLWVGSDQGLLRYERERDRFEAASNGSSGHLDGARILSIFQDRTGLFWFGTRSRGIAIWNPRSWLLGHHQPQWSLNHNVTSFASSPDRIWIGTLGGGLIEHQTGSEQDRQLGAAAGLKDERVMTLARDGRAQLWVGTMTAGLQVAQSNGAVDRFAAPKDPDTRTTLATTGIMSLLPGNDGSLWIGTFGQGLLRLNTSSHALLSAGKDLSLLADRQVMALAEDARGHVWAGTDAGLFEIAPETGAVRAFRRDDGDDIRIPAQTIYALHVDENDTLWIGTSDAGVVRLTRDAQGQPSAFVQSPIASLANSSVYGIESDPEGHLWLSTNSGLHRIAPSRLQSEQFKPLHGAQGLEYNFGAAHQDRSGKLLFGGAQGYNHFDPVALRKPENKPQLVLTRFERQNATLPEDQPYHRLSSIAADHHENVLRFSVALHDYNDPGNNRYSFYLENFDSDWRPWSTERDATYTNLDPGQYRLHVRARTSYGTESVAPLAVSLAVAPPLWQSPIAKIAYGLAVLFALGLLAQRLRERELRRKRYQAKLEAEVAERTEALAHSNRELERATQAKSDFLARMSHEIRTPMNGVYGTAQLLLRTPLSGEQQSLANTIHRSSESLLTLISDILDFSKIEAEKLTLEVIDFDLVELAEDCAALFAGEARRKGLELRVNVPAASLGYRSDPTRIRQVLSNLVGNAIKFTDSGFVELALHIDSDGGPQLTVRDSGIGIADEQQSLIFEDFAQADGSTTRTHGGTGLGLSISKQLSELLGATLTLDSKTGLGSSFLLSLPPAPIENAAMLWQPPAASDLPQAVALLLSSNAMARIVAGHLSALGIETALCRTVDQLRDAIASAAPQFPVLCDIQSSVMLNESLARDESRHRIVLAYPDETTPANVGRLSLPLSVRALITGLVTGEATAEPPAALRFKFQGAAMPVLVVEDNAVNREVITGMLDLLAVPHQTAADGPQALARCAEQRYGLVLMDCGLPDIDGLEVSRRLRAGHSPNVDTPIIALTANDMAGERERCLEAGMNDFLSKPCAMDALATAMVPWLANATLARIPVPAPKTVAVAEPALPSKAANEADVPDEIRLDLDALERIRALQGPGREDLVERIVRLFVADLDKLLPALETELQAERLDAAGKIAHRLKSASGNVGAMGYADLFRALEEQCRGNAIVPAQETCQRLRRMEMQLCEGLIAQLDERGAQSA